MDYKALLGEISASYQSVLRDKLVGIYVHGSIAFGCFNEQKSDIDFLVVTRSEPTIDEKVALVEKLLELDAEAPDKGFEMSVVNESVCRSFVYPTPFTLHFSNMHSERCRTDPRAYCETMNGVDPDLAAHFTVTRAVGIVLYGRPVAEVFGSVPKSDYLASIMDDVGNAAEDVAENPLYIVLNLCRVLAYKLDDAVVSKRGGGEWGIKNLPEKYRGLLADALRCYESDSAFSPDMVLAVDFAKYMLERIKE